MRSKETPFDNCMRAAMTAVTGVSSELHSDPFPAWSSHSHLVNASRQFWPIRGSDSQLMTNQRLWLSAIDQLKEIWNLRLGWKWRVRCSLQCMLQVLQTAACEICLCHPSHLSDCRIIAQGENSAHRLKKSLEPFFNQSNCVIYALIQPEMEP